jgi:hypothetical protein
MSLESGNFVGPPAPEFLEHPDVGVLKVKQTAARQTCPYCGKRVKADSPWCPVCGRNLIKSPSEKALPPSPARQAASEAFEESLLPAARTPYNPFASLGFLLGIAAIFLYELGVVPVLGLILSVAGRILAGKRRGKGRIPAEIGIAVNGLYSVMFLLHLYGYL